MSLGSGIVRNTLGIVQRRIYDVDPVLMETNPNFCRRRKFN